MNLTTPLLFLALLAGCRQETTSAQRTTNHAPVPILHPEGKDLAARFTPPADYQRKDLPPNSFGYYLRHIALRPHGAAVHYFDGREKANPGIYAAVLTLDVGDKDLQQCADAVMRLRAEYLWSNHRADEISFDLTSGFKVDYPHWREGYRVKFNASKASWVKTTAPANDYAAYRAYLDFVYTYAGTLSLSKMLRPVTLMEMQVGDVFILGGSPGHAVTVMDMAVNAAGKKVYLLSQSYMPAQDIQVLENPDNKAISPWYELDDRAPVIHTPQWDFTINQLKRFP